MAFASLPGQTGAEHQEPARVKAPSATFLLSWWDSQKPLLPPYDSLPGLSILGINLYNDSMEREQVLQMLHQHRTEINAYGVKSLALFGSVARGEAQRGSDVDLLVEFDRPVGLFGLIALQLRLEEILGCPVDIGTADSLKASIRPRVMEECVYVP